MYVLPTELLYGHLAHYQLTLDRPGDYLVIDRAGLGRNLDELRLPQPLLTERVGKGLAAARLIFPARFVPADTTTGIGAAGANVVAPDIDATDGAAYVDGDPVVPMWAEGDTLGEKCHDQELIDAGIIADPAGVGLVGWEVVGEAGEAGEE